MAKAQVITIVPGNEALGRQLALTLQPEDALEIKELGYTSEEGVLKSMEISKHNWAAVTEDGVICMWGIGKDVSLLGGGVFWFLTSIHLDKYTLPFVRGAKKVLRELTGEYGYLENLVDSRHKRAQRLLEFMGFELDPEHGIVGVNGVPFHKFSIRL